MSGYVFSRKADRELDRVYQYTLENHGTGQAKKYIIDLHAHLHELSTRRKFWRRLPNSLVIPSDLDMQAYMSKYKHHYIFFRQLSGGKIGVMAIYHERRDLPVRLATDLLRMEQLDEQS